MKSIIVIDTENVSSNRIGTIEQVKIDSINTGFVAEIFLIGCHAGARRHFIDPIKLHFPDAEIIDVPCAPFPNAADIVCALQIGHAIARIGDELKTIYLISYDKLVLYSGFFALKYGFSLVIPDTASLPPNAEGKTNYRRIRLTKESKAGIPEINKINSHTPWWAEAEIKPDEYIGLIVKTVQSEDKMKIPYFIPFPEFTNPLTIGSSSNKCSISLECWEKQKKGFNLYSPHAEFRYLPWPESKWTIRSLHGTRKGSKKIELNSKLITATNGMTSLYNGDKITLGDFEFIFKSNPKLEIIWYEDLKQLIVEIETSLRNAANRVKEEELSENLRNELIFNGLFSFDNAYFRHYGEILSCHWDIFQEWTLQLFDSKKSFRRAFGSLNRIRNQVMHPSKTPISNEDKIKFAELYIKLINAVNQNRKIKNTNITNP